MASPSRMGGEAALEQMVAAVGSTAQYTEETQI
jgi:hypothetical protein